MIIGFTGTRAGMTEAQRDYVTARLKPRNVRAVVHGGCHGADEQFDLIAYGLGRYRRVRPGPTSDSWLEGAEVMPRQPFLTRNRNIVKDCHLLLACPGGPERKRGSGTWATIRYARAADHPLVIVWPDGTVEE